MEMFEAEAKDSEEESNGGITKHFVKRNTKSPNTMNSGLHSTTEISDTLPASKTLDKRPNIVDPKSMLTVPSTNSKSIHSGKFDKHDSVVGPTFEEADVFSTARCSVPSDIHIKTSEAEKQKVKNEPVTTPSNGARSPQLCAASYSRKTPLKSPLPLFSGERLHRADVTCKMEAGEIKDNAGVDVSLSKMEQVKDVTFSGHGQNSLRGTDLFGTGGSNARSPLKRISDVSQSHKMSEDTKSCTKNSPSIDERLSGLEMRSVSLNNDGSSERRAKNLQHSLSITDTSSSIKKPLSHDLPFSNIVLSPTEDVAADSKKSPQTPLQIPGENMLPVKLNHNNGISEEVIEKTEEKDRQHIGGLVTSESDSRTEAKKFASPTNLNFSNVQNKDSNSKRQRIKMFAKKSLGSRPKLGSASRKGSAHSNKTTSCNDSISSTCGNDKKLFSTSLEDASFGVEKVVEATDGDIFHKYESMEEDEKTIGPETKEADFEKQMMDKDNLKEVQLISDVDKLAKKAESGVKCKHSTSVFEDMISSGTIKEVTEPVTIGNIQLDELEDRGPMPMNSLKIKSEQGKVGKAPHKKIGKTGKKSRVVAAGPNIEVHTIPDYKSEKENEPCDGDKTCDLVNQCIEKPTVKSNTNQRKTNKTSSEISVQSSMAVEKVSREVKSEPVCFILSGHRLDRKEFQKVIKHLKGRVCRDSHQWSYQATHYITSHPVRRTEKFFSAAASGR